MPNFAKKLLPAKIFINFYTRTQLLSIINIIGCTLFLSGQEVSPHHTCIETKYVPENNGKSVPCWLLGNSSDHLS